jgi:hypothetical protein
LCWVAKQQSSEVLEKAAVQNDVLVVFRHRYPIMALRNRQYGNGRGTADRRPHTKYFALHSERSHEQFIAHFIGNLLLTSSFISIDLSSMQQTNK